MTMDKQQAAREAFEANYLRTHNESSPYASDAELLQWRSGFLRRDASGRYEGNAMQSFYENWCDAWQAARSTLMPALVEARDAIIEARRNIDAVDNALADAFMWDALARLNTIIGEK